MGGELMAVIFTLLELWLLSHTGTPADQGQQGQQGQQGEQGEDTEYLHLHTANLCPQ